MLDLLREGEVEKARQLLRELLGSGGDRRVEQCHIATAAEESAPRAGKVFLLGAGPGDPGLITVRGLQCLRAADVVIYDHLVNPKLLDEAPASAERVYVGKLAWQHTLRQAVINALLVANARAGNKVVRLKGGDPFVFGRGGEEAQELATAGIAFEVVPGVSSAVAVPAYAGIPVTHRVHASSFAVVTGHEDATKPVSRLSWAKLATAVDTIVCLMGAQNLSEIVAQLLRHGRDAATPVALIRWGTWPQQETLVGTLANIVELVAARQFGAPAIAVIGEVVRLRDQIAWFDEAWR